MVAKDLSGQPVLPICCPEMSLANYWSNVRVIPEGKRPFTLCRKFEVAHCLCILKMGLFIDVEYKMCVLLMGQPRLLSAQLKHGTRPCDKKTQLTPRVMYTT